jgi:DNA-binding NtrC family response regulator
VKVLVLDDLPDILAFEVSFLRPRFKNVEFIPVASYAEAVNSISKDKPQILLLDIELNERRSGFDVYEYAKGALLKFQTAVVGGDLAGDKMRKLKELGINYYLEKPVALEDLEQLIAELIEKESR